MLVILLFQLASFAAQLESAAPNPYTIKVNVGLAVLPITVTDHGKHSAAGLKEENFEVYEDGRRQKIVLFEDKDAPVTVGLVVDNSLSMEPKRTAVVAAAMAFAKSSNPLDELFVVNFNQSIHFELPEDVHFIRNPGELHAALSVIRSSGRTALYDAVGEALEHLKLGTGNKKYLIVVSDGGDNASHHSRSEILASAKRSNAAIYTVAILNENFADQDPAFLGKLAHESGGRFYSPKTVPEVVSALELIARDIRQQYTLGYVPINQTEDGKFRHIRVTASAPGEGRLAVRTREGYLAPMGKPGLADALKGPAQKL
jgi:VWFA-related protein